MTKCCQFCGDDYFARWRNAPAICETCALRAIVCPGCWKVTVAADPAQLALFDVDAALAACARWRPLSVLVGNHFANSVPRNFDWESYTEALLSTRPPRNHELEDTPPWPRRVSRAERMRYPFH